MYDRAMQTLHALAFEPVAETIGDPFFLVFVREEVLKMPVNRCDTVYHAIFDMERSISSIF